MNTTYAVLLYEDNDLLRESIETLMQINDKFRIVAAYPNVHDILKQLETHHPDIILMDIEMPGMTGIEALKKIRHAKATVPVVMLTVFDDNVNVLNAIYAGATGYLLKKHISTKLFEAMEETLNGGAPMSPSVARMVISSMQKPANAYGLTPKEEQILRSLSNGNSYKLIAAEFQISIDTVRTHIKKIYEKLQVHSQTEAVSKAIQEKLV
ncbi:MAG TPA: response regulator transcription factor [Ohtaekwangia sp.]|nr:response regulator transcription factor [Ohtaekwangia sp.]